MLDGGCRKREADSLMRYVDFPFVKQVYHFAKSQRELHLQHHRQADDVGKSLEIAKRIDLADAETLRIRSTGLKCRVF